MQKFILSSLVLLLSVFSAIAVPVTLAWTAPNPIPPDLAGYILDYGTSPNPSTTGTHVNVGNVTTYTVDIPVGIKHYFVVRTVNTAGLTSAPSNEVSHTVPVPTPTPTPTPVPTPTPSPSPSPTATPTPTPTPSPSPSPSPTATPTPTPTPEPLTLRLLGAVSRRAHGTRGNFDVDLARDATSLPPIESRSGSNFTLVLTFNKNVVSGKAFPAARSNKKAQLDGNPKFLGNTMTVKLKNVSDTQIFRVTLTDIKAADGSVLPPTVVRCRVLIGDVDTNNIVNTDDRIAVQSSIDAPVGSSNFRLDVNFSGNINSNDVSAVQNHLGHSSPIN